MNISVFTNNCYKFIGAVDNVLYMYIVMYHPTHKVTEDGTLLMHACAYLLHACIHIIKCNTVDISLLYVLMLLVYSMQ